MSRLSAASPGPASTPPGGVRVSGRRWRIGAVLVAGLSLVAASLGPAGDTRGPEAPPSAGAPTVNLRQDNGVYSLDAALGGSALTVGAGLDSMAASAEGARGTQRASVAATSTGKIRVGARERLTVIVNLKTAGGLSRANAIAKKHRASRTASWPSLAVAVYALPAGASQAKANAFVKALRASASVASAGVSGVISPQPSIVRRVTVARRPANSVGAIATMARSVQANKISTGKGVTVGVADEGIFDENPAVAGKVNTKLGASCLAGGKLVSGSTQGRPTAADAGHGTAVANVIAGSASVGPSRGIAPGAKVASVRVVTAAGSIFAEASICAQQWAIKHRLPVLNMSYGVDWAGTLVGGLWNPRNADQAAVITAMKRSQAYAQKRGVLTVAAAGNDGADFSDKSSLEDAQTGQRLSKSMLGLPAELPGVVVASMTQRNGKIDRWSTVGLGLVDLAAQGTAKLASGRTTFETVTGTSFASPAVAGTAALLKAKHPSWTPAKIAVRLRSSATHRTCAKAGTIVSRQPCRASKGRTSFFGSGTLNAEAALKAR
ncbi:MAG: S8 family serine peptidase [Arthrobacter sp.]|nr:S8 family serine peptidase [Arthrobacter sp.]